MVCILMMNPKCLFNKKEFRHEVIIRNATHDRHRIIVKDKPLVPMPDLK
jgi:hypothetical protein